MSEEEREFRKMAADAYYALMGRSGSALDIGLLREFDKFKTEVVTTVKEQTRATEKSNAAAERNNNRQTVIIAGLGLLVTVGLLLCAILGIALNRKGGSSTLLSHDPVITASSDAAVPINP